MDTQARLAQDKPAIFVCNKGNEAFGVRAMIVLGIGALVIAAATLASVSALLHCVEKRPPLAMTF